MSTSLFFYPLVLHPSIFSRNKLFEAHLICGGVWLFFMTFLPLPPGTQLLEEKASCQEGSVWSSVCSHLPSVTAFCSHFCFFILCNGCSRRRDELLVGTQWTLSPDFCSSFPRFALYCWKNVSNIYVIVYYNSSQRPKANTRPFVFSIVQAEVQPPKCQNAQDRHWVRECPVTRGFPLLMQSYFGTGFLSAELE